MENHLKFLLAPSVSNDYADIRYEDKKIYLIKADPSNLRDYYYVNSGYHIREFNNDIWQSNIFVTPDKKKKKSYFRYSAK
jgi:hypothetical protein